MDLEMPSMPRMSSSGHGWQLRASEEADTARLVRLALRTSLSEKGLQHVSTRRVHQIFSRIRVDVWDFIHDTSLWTVSGEPSRKRGQNSRVGSSAPAQQVGKRIPSRETTPHGLGGQNRGCDGR